MEVGALLPTAWLPGAVRHSQTLMPWGLSTHGWHQNLLSAASLGPPVAAALGPAMDAS